VTGTAGPSSPIEPARLAAAEIVRTLRDAGHAAYFAGGCVRDELLGLTPDDYDIATDAPPARISALFRRTSEVGASFGVVLVKAGHDSIEVATFRSEGPYSDRRRPDTVRFSDAPTDARRRDFTINALFLDPLDLDTAPQSPRGGRVIDHVGGTEDLVRRVLRAVGDPDQRLAEDHLRALRAVRLTARLGLALDPATGAAISRHARDLAGISRERIGDELRKILAHPGRARAVMLLHELGLDGPVLNEPPRAWSAGSLATLDASGISVTTALAAWALDRGTAPGAPGGGEVSRRWRRALCLSNEETESLKHAVAGVGILEREWVTLGTPARKRAAASDWFGAALSLVDSRDAARAGSIHAEVDALARSESGLAPRPLITGDDLVAASLTPGPAFKSVLDRVYDAQLEERVRTTGEALALALKLAEEHGTARVGGKQVGGAGGERGGGEPGPRPGV